jgi:hypothetical protein
MGEREREREGERSWILLTLWYVFPFVIDGFYHFCCGNTKSKQNAAAVYLLINMLHKTVQ